MGGSAEQDGAADWKAQLKEAVRGAQARVFGWQNICHVQHGRLVTTALTAFGQDPRATFFIEVLAPAGDIPRPDLILLHPDVGALVIENKGVNCDGIEAVDGTMLTLVRDGRLKHEDPFAQAERVMFRLRALASHRMNTGDALFLRTVAMPLIGRQEFEGRFHTKWPAETLFAEECCDAGRFRAHVVGFADRVQMRAGGIAKLSKRSDVALGIILNGKGLLHTPRRGAGAELDPMLLGAQIQEMELGLKEPTPQQKELGEADLRGHHRLFRGVAGSGKSVMLAMSVGLTLANFDAEGTGLFDAPTQRKRVLVVCYNRTLVHYLRRRIDERYGRLTWKEAKDDVLTVTHMEDLIRKVEVREPRMISGLLGTTRRTNVPAGYVTHSTD
ncbi:MAG TPA: hypothetical protein VEA69_21815 [Tepidisphaeraceae bacterium]|nr:hypothetical protein [Tepidisphaeraceae bacterium]